MRWTRVESSVAFWAFSAVLYGLCFSLITVQAEALYRKTPRLAPRDRETLPAASPLLDLKRDERVHPSPPPALEGSLVPVGWQPEPAEQVASPSPKLPPAQKTRGAMKSTTQSRVSPHSQSVRPQTKEPSAQRASKVSSAHQKKLVQDPNPWQPTVVVPVSDGPKGGKNTGSASQVPRQSTLKATASKSVVSAPPSASTQTQGVSTPKSSSSASPQKGRISQQAPATLPASAPNKGHRRSSEKALVHFPQALAATAPHRKSRLEPGFYPVGYRPYLPAPVVLVSGKHQDALSHYNRGSYYGHADQLSQAIREYQAAIHKNPDFADAYVGLSSAYLLKRQWEDVFINARKALAMKAGFIDPKNIIQAKYNLSTAFCAADDYRKARSFYKAIKRANHPQTRELWEYLQKNCKGTP